MKNNILVFILVLFLVFIFCLCSMYQYNSIIDIDLSKYVPFSKNNLLLKYNTNFKLTNNLPKIEATSAFYPFSANFVQNIYDESFYSNAMLQLVSTQQAYFDIIAGKTDIIIATEPSDAQKEYIKNSNVELVYKSLYLEPLVIFLNTNNIINNLNIEQIQKMYFNNVNWSEFGTNFGNVHTYQLEKNNGSQTCFESIVKNNICDNNHFEIDTMPKIIDDVAQDKNGIGYAFYSYFSKMHINKNTKFINVNGKSPILDDYPLLFEVFLIYRADNINENISQIINWLDTQEGNNFIDSIKF